MLPTKERFTLSKRLLNKLSEDTLLNLLSFSLFRGRAQTIWVKTYASKQSSDWEVGCFFFSNDSEA